VIDYDIVEHLACQVANNVPDDTNQKADTEVDLITCSLTA